MREKILAVIEKNSRIDIKDLAVLLGESEVAVANEIAEMEKEMCIRDSCYYNECRHRFYAGCPRKNKSADCRPSDVAKALPSLNASSFSIVMTSS